MLYSVFRRLSKSKCGLAGCLICITVGFAPSAQQVCLYFVALVLSRDGCTRRNLVGGKRADLRPGAGNVRHSLGLPVVKPLPMGADRGAEVSPRRHSVDQRRASIDPEALSPDHETNFRRALDHELQRISAFYETKVSASSISPLA